MGALMELVAGDERDILLAIGVDDWAGLADPTRFTAFLSMGGGLDPTWLDLFSEACRSVTESGEPVDFLDARRELDGPGDIGERTIERVDEHWIDAIARISDHDVDRVAGRWIDLLDEEFGTLPREDKPWIRQLASDLVAFARSADRAPDVLFAWSL
ncbi:MAG TPA: hypothetical protein VF323_11265 [Candidatus Limnocylindrales bacterium]